jgi:hypothetical protein
MRTSSLTVRMVYVELPCSGGGWESDDSEDTPVRPNAPVPHMLALPVATEIVSPPSRHHHHHHHHHESHICQAFYQLRTSFRPATATMRPPPPCFYCASCNVVVSTTPPRHLQTRKTCETRSKVPVPPY